MSPSISANTGRDSEQLFAFRVERIIDALRAQLPGDPDDTPERPIHTDNTG